MPERKDKRYSMPWKYGSKRGKALSVGEVFSLVIPYHWIFSSTKAAAVRSDVGVLRCLLESESCSCLLGPSWAVPGEGPALCCPGPRPSEVRVIPTGMAVTCRWEGSCSSQLLWSSACTHLYFTLSASIWQLVTVTLSARCWGTGKPGGMKPFEVVTQTLIKCPGWAFIPPLDPCLQLLNCLRFFQMCYFIMMPPGLGGRAIIIFIV